MLEQHGQGRAIVCRGNERHAGIAAAAPRYWDAAAYYPTGNLLTVYGCQQTPHSHISDSTSNGGLNRQSKAID